MPGNFSYLLDEAGEPYPAPQTEEGRAAANRLLCDPEARRVAVCELSVDGHEVLISTVFLVLNHGLWEARPVLFESLIFVDGESIEASMRRYETRKEAEIGHAELTRQAEVVVAAWLKARRALINVSELPALISAPGEDA